MPASFLFTATPSNPKSPLGFSVWLNESVLFDIDRLTKPETIVAEFDDDIDNLEYTIKIVLKNKTAEHTKIDNLGAIVEDSMISISNTKLDDIDLGHLFFEKSKYYHAFNTDAEPVVNAFYGDMGCNGTVEFKFTSPVYLWLLENM